MNRLSKSSPKPTGDTLGAYPSKRDFALTPEPAEVGQTRGHSVGDRFTFVVQKHWASHRHYDFRLGLDGALKRGW